VNRGPAPDPRKVAAVAKAYAAGKPTSEIAKRFDVCEKTVRRYARAAGCEIYPRGRRPYR